MHSELPAASRKPVAPMPLWTRPIVTSSVTPYQRSGEIETGLNAAPLDKFISTNASSSNLPFGSVNRSVSEALAVDPDTEAPISSARASDPAAPTTAVASNSVCSLSMELLNTRCRSMRRGSARLTFKLLHMCACARFRRIVLSDAYRCRDLVDVDDPRRRYSDAAARSRNPRAAEAERPRELRKARRHDPDAR